ncbi:hypothetical protein [Alkanindiges hydrocarboniclasticus]|uniref:hypothetical protein n=1 Tax=Alkanindiges hydrocarboniclasticus TaxID=1907941 RepID=UPI0009FAF6D9|nr:hypothetical protein [Alkanindiges hydrocarboniclasticus]
MNLQEIPQVCSDVDVGKEVEKIIEIAITIRGLFLNILKASTYTDNTNGSCAYACYFAKYALDKFTDFRTAYRGGDGNGDGGYIDAHGNFHGHYWLEVLTAAGSYIIDITADQFGDKPVVVLALNQTSHYVAGCQKTVDEHFTDFLAPLASHFE